MTPADAPFRTWIDTERAIRLAGPNFKDIREPL